MIPDTQLAQSPIASNLYVADFLVNTTTVRTVQSKLLLVGGAQLLNAIPRFGPWNYCSNIWTKLRINSITFIGPAIYRLIICGIKHGTINWKCWKMSLGCSNSICPTSQFIRRWEITKVLLQTILLRILQTYRSNTVLIGFTSHWRTNGRIGSKIRKILPLFAKLHLM